MTRVSLCTEERPPVTSALTAKIDRVMNRLTDRSDIRRLTDASGLPPDNLPVIVGLPTVHCRERRWCVAFVTAAIVY